MVQIIPRAESPSDRFAKAFANLGQSAAKEIPQAFLQRNEDRSLEQLIGKDLSNIRDPHMRQQFVNMALQRENEAAKLQESFEADSKNYESIKKAFGEEFADVWLAMGQGERTALVNDALDAMRRGEGINDIFSQMDSENLEGFDQTKIRSRNENTLEALPDFTKRPRGFDRKEWAKEMHEWAKSNNETLKNSRERLRGNKRDVLGTKKLVKINQSHQLPEGLERWIINPKTGEIYGLAQLAQKAPTAAQEWVKEIARFGNRAKDAYGSRVTNFDLMQYMKQFPSLLNTFEGRQNILRMMEINYELDSLYDKAVQSIIDRKGAGKIPPDEVDRIAREMIKDREEKLFEDYLNVESQNENSYVNEGLKRPSLEEIFG